MKTYLVYDNAREYLASDPPMEAAYYGEVDFITVDVDRNDNGTIHIWGRSEIYIEDNEGYLIPAQPTPTT